MELELIIQDLSVALFSPSKVHILELMGIVTACRVCCLPGVPLPRYEVPTLPFIPLETHTASCLCCLAGVPLLWDKTITLPRNHLETRVPF
jgi:hypothetical protein